MLKAVQHSTYFKNGRQMLTYKVMGPAAEIEEYKIIESARLNRTPDQIAIADGFPLLFLALDQILGGGGLPQPSYNLVKNYAGTGYNRDTMAADMARYARVAAKTEDHMAEIQAKRALGISVGDQAQRGQRTFVAPAQATPAVETTADDIAAAIAEGANIAEHGELINEAVGEETLGG